MTIVDTIKEMLTSKKFLASIAGFIVTAAARIGLELDPVVVAALLSSILVYVLSQGWADTGKEAAKIEHETEKMRLEHEEKMIPAPSPTAE